QKLIRAQETSDARIREDLSLRRDESNSRQTLNAEPLVQRFDLVDLVRPIHLDVHEPRRLGYDGRVHVGVALQLIARSAPLRAKAVHAAPPSAPKSIITGRPLSRAR